MQEIKDPLEDRLDFELVIAQMHAQTPSFVVDSEANETCLDLGNLIY